MKTSRIITSVLAATTLSIGMVSAEDIVILNKEGRINFSGNTDEISKIAFEDNKTTLSVYDREEVQSYTTPLAEIGSMTGQKDVNYMKYLEPAIVISTFNADMWQRIINLGPEHYAQYFVNEPKYENQTCQVNNQWMEDWFWVGTAYWMYNLDKAIADCKDQPEYSNILQIARVWRVWVASRLTDYFGDIPYYGIGSLYLDAKATPAYETQEFIYNDMLKELAEASEAFAVDAADQVVYNDPIFAGDIAKWRAFANTLRLRLAMRLTEVAPEKAQAEAKAAVEAEGGLVTENVTIWKARNYYVNYSANLFYVYPHYWGKSLAMSRSMERILTNLGGIAVTKPANRTESTETVPYVVKGNAIPHVDWNDNYIPDFTDPRALIMFDVTSPGTLASYSRERYKENGKNAGWTIKEDYRGRWRGIESGMPLTEANEANNNCINNSRLGSFFITPQRPDNYLKSADTPTDAELVEAEARNQILVYANEVDFLLAEACVRGYITGDAKSHYEEGIRKSMLSYNRDKELISESTISDYLASSAKNLMGTSVAFDDCEGDNLSGNHNSRLYKIMTQKYLAGFPENGYEAWNDYRRTGMPALDPMRGAAEGSVLENGAPDWKGSLRRFTYPKYQQKNNAENYEEVAKRIGGDLTSTRMWWDARTTIVE